MENKDKVIFIHIPKTGGTTINSAMNNTFWQTEVGFNYRHILANKKSNSGDIFDSENINKYKEYIIFMMLRDPIDRLISEYYFIKERQEFIDLLKNKPKTFESYIKNRQTQNAVVNFLRGRRMYDLHAANQEDLNEVLNAIDNTPIHIGIFEQFAESLYYFGEKTGIKWKKNIEVKRMTFKRPQAKEISNEIRDLILEHNQLDVKLYEHGLKKFNTLNNEQKKLNISFNKDKYNHVIPYCAKWCFFEFCMDNKKFIKQNFDFFKRLTFYLIETKGIRDGKTYTKSWNESFIKSIQITFPNSDFADFVTNNFDVSDEPLDQTSRIAKSVDDFFTENKHHANKYYKKLIFDETQVVISKDKGWFSSIFKS